MCGFVACEERFWWLSWDRPFESKLIKIVYEKISAIKYLVAKKSGAALKVPHIWNFIRNYRFPYVVLSYFMLLCIWMVTLFSAIFGLICELLNQIYQ